MNGAVVKLSMRMDATVPTISYMRLIAVFGTGYLGVDFEDADGLVTGRTSGRMKVRQSLPTVWMKPPRIKLI